MHPVRWRARALLAALLALLAVLLPCLPLMWPWLRRRRRQALSPPAHRQRPRDALPAAGRFVRTSRGETFVVTEGDRNASSTLVVLVHGNVGSTRYLDSLASALVAAGKRVLRYDLYGRGWSACGGWEHTAELFVGQLAEVLFACGVTAPIDLIGYSIGAQVAASFAATHSQQVRRLVLLCPALVLSGPLRALPMLLQLPPVRWLAGLYSLATLRDREWYADDWLHVRTSAISAARLDAVHAIECDRFDHEPHLARSFGASIAGMPWGDRPEEYRRLAASGMRVHALCAARDTIVPGEQAAAWLRSVLGTGAEVTMLLEHGHSLPYETPEECCALLLERLDAD